MIDIAQIEKEKKNKCIMLHTKIKYKTSYIRQSNTHPQRACTLHNYT